MPARPDPDRVDDHGFTCLEAARLVGVSDETIRRWCNTVPGFAVRVGDGFEWRVSPLAAMTALALRHKNKRRVRAGEIAARLPEATRVIYDFVQTACISPAMRDALADAWRDKLRGYLERRRSKPPPDEELRKSAARVLVEAGDVVG